MISLKLGKKILQPINKLPVSLIYFEIKNSETILNNLPTFNIIIGIIITKSTINENVIRIMYNEVNLYNTLLNCAHDIIVTT